jgi:raffinose/stachyose/melibiose transport system substrate-binding protein
MKRFKFSMVISMILVLALSFSLITVQAASTTAIKKVSLTLAASQNWIKDVDKSLAAACETKLGIKIDIQVNPDAQYAMILKTKIASGEAPDIFMCQAGLGMQEFMPDKNFADLSKEKWVSRLNTWAKAVSSNNGKVVGLNTWGADGWMMVYDPALFTKYKVSVPKNYKELLAACKIFKANNIIPIYEPVKDTWHTPMFLATMTSTMLKGSPSIINDLNSGKAKLADVPALKTALTQVKELADKGYFGDNFMSDTWDKSYEMLGTGKAAMLCTYSAYPNEVLAKFPNSNAANYSAFPVPLADNTSFTFNGGGEMRVMYKNTKKPASVKMYFDYLTSIKNLKTYYDARTDLLGSSFKDYKGKTTKLFDTFVSKMDPNATELYGSVKFFDLMSVGKHMQEMLVKGGLTPVKALQGMDNDRDLLLKAVSKNK